MLWVYGRYKYFYSHSVGIDFSHQNLMSTDDRHCQILTTKIDPRAARVNMTALGAKKGSNIIQNYHSSRWADDKVVPLRKQMPGSDTEKPTRRI